MRVVFSLCLSVALAASGCIKYTITSEATFKGLATDQAVRSARCTFNGVPHTSCLDHTASAGYEMHASMADVGGLELIFDQAKQVSIEYTREDAWTSMNPHPNCKVELRKNGVIVGSVPDNEGDSKGSRTITAVDVAPGDRLLLEEGTDGLVCGVHIYSVELCAAGFVGNGACLDSQGRGFDYAQLGDSDSGTSWTFEECQTACGRSSWCIGFNYASWPPHNVCIFYFDNDPSTHPAHSDLPTPPGGESWSDVLTHPTGIGPPTQASGQTAYGICYKFDRSAVNTVGNGACLDSEGRGFDYAQLGDSDSGTSWTFEQCEMACASSWWCLGFNYASWPPHNVCIVYFDNDPTTHPAHSDLPTPPGGESWSDVLTHPTGIGPPKQASGQSEYGKCYKTTSTCTNGVHDQREDGVDCGGPCSPCGCYALDGFIDSTNRVVDAELKGDINVCQQFCAGHNSQYFSFNHLENPPRDCSCAKPSLGASVMANDNEKIFHTACTDSSDWCAYPIDCAPSCTGLSVGQGVQVSKTDGDEYLSVASFSCPDTYELFGDSSVKCTSRIKAGPWPDFQAECREKVKCDPPTSVAAADVSLCTGIYVGSSCTVTCAEGYTTADGPETQVDCMADGNSWTWGDMPVCGLSAQTKLKNLKSRATQFAALIASAQSKVKDSCGA